MTLLLVTFMSCYGNRLCFTDEVACNQIILLVLIRDFTRRQFQSVFDFGVARSNIHEELLQNIPISYLIFYKLSWRREV